MRPNPRLLAVLFAIGAGLAPLCLSLGVSTARAQELEEDGGWRLLFIKDGKPHCHDPGTECHT